VCDRRSDFVFRQRDRSAKEQAKCTCYFPTLPKTVARCAMFYEESISWIANTPLGIKIRNIEFVPTHMHEDIVEIIFCLKGNVKFSYGYETFTLSTGEF
jgi:mannose-6-phosphate isomerase-like protein (cupin superfamily)